MMCVGRLGSGLITKIVTTALRWLLLLLLGNCLESVGVLGHCGERRHLIDAQLLLLHWMILLVLMVRS